MIDCPKCKGGKEPLCCFPAFPSKKMLEKSDKELMEIFHCLQCGGTGKVPEEMLKWIEEGEILRSRRIDTRITLRQAAKYLNIQPSILSEMERGVRKPDTTLNYQPLIAIGKPSNENPSKYS